MSSPVVDPASGLPIGPEVSPHAAPYPQRCVLDGRFVRLEPIDPVRHGASLWRESHGADRDALWQYLFEAPFPDEHAFDAHLQRLATAADRVFYAIVDRDSGAALGYQSLMRIDPANRCIEVGSILYGPRLQRRPGGTEAQFLLMQYVFDQLGYRRYEWKCNALNLPSQRAAARFGFTFEGVFRQHMIIRGRSRDTAWYAIIDPEWPTVKEAMLRWLAPGNFDASGNQKQGLVAIRAAL